jgi:hypothetical protein
MAHTKLRSQFAKFVFKHDWARELTCRVLNIAPQRMAAERLCKQVALEEGLLRGFCWLWHRGELTSDMCHLCGVMQLYLRVDDFWQVIAVD